MNPHVQLAIDALARSSLRDDMRRAERAFAGYSADLMNAPYGENPETPNEILAGYRERQFALDSAIAWLKALRDEPLMRQTLNGLVPVSVDGIDQLDAQLGRVANRLARAEKTIAELREAMNTFAAAGKLHKVECCADNSVYMTFLVEGNMRLVNKWDFTDVTITPKELDDFDTDY